MYTVYIYIYLCRDYTGFGVQGLLGLAAEVAGLDSQGQVLQFRGLGLRVVEWDWPPCLAHRGSLRI